MNKIHEEARKQFYRNLVDNNNKLYPKLVYKYRSFSMNSLYALQKHSLWFSSHEDFNDPYEGKLTPPNEELGKLIKDMGVSVNHEELMRLGLDFLSAFDPYLKEQRICCFSRKNNDILLWAHYADEHRGFCMEFEVLDDVEFFLPILPVVYEQDFAPANPWRNPGKILEQIYQRKSISWKNEEEVRIIKKGKKGLRPYRPQALKSIIFGCRATDADMDIVKSILPSTVHYKKAEISKTSYQLNIIDLC